MYDSLSLFKLCRRPILYSHYVLEYNDLKKQEVENDCVVLMDDYSPSSSVPSPSVPFVAKINIEHRTEFEIK
jgi:hypothetical protein